MSIPGQAFRVARAAVEVPRALFRASTSVPNGPRPTVTQWWTPPNGPPVSWWPASGELQTHWDGDLWSAFAVPGYWRGRMLISQAIGGMPLAAWRGLEQLDPAPTVLAAPALGEDRCTTVAAWVGDLIDHGNAVGFYEPRDSRGVPRGIIPVPATEVAVGYDADGVLTYEHRPNGAPMLAAPWTEVFHAKGVLPYPGALRGLGVLEAGLSTLARVSAQDRYASQAFTTGTPSGLLRVKDPDLQAGSPDDEPGFSTAAGIKKQWKASVATGDVAVLSELVDFTPLAWSPTDAQMTEARTLSLVDVANLLNVDPYWCGASQVSAPYQNVQDAAVALARFTLSAWLNPLEAQFSRCLPYGTEARFNRDTVLRDTASVRIANWVQLLNANVVDEAYVRAQEGIPEDAAPTEVAGPPVSPAPNVAQLFPATDGATNDQAVSNG